METQFYLVDVFAQAPFTGNPLPVFIGANALSEDQMQAIARWFNMSETTFVTAPTNAQADYAVRIFTPVRELPFAGHPTLGSCRAWLASGGKPRREDVVVQECRAGLISIKRTGEQLAFAAPPLLREGPVGKEKTVEVAAFLNVAVEDIVEATWADNGPGWVVVLFESAEKALSVRPQKTYPGTIDVGIVGPHPKGAPADFELRAFFTDQNGMVREDPVTGSLNASVAQWLFATGRAKGRYVAAQGRSIGHAGRIELSIDADNQVWVGGKAVILSGGRLAVPL